MIHEDFILNNVTSIKIRVKNSIVGKNLKLKIDSLFPNSTEGILESTKCDFDGNFAVFSGIKVFEYQRELNFEKFSLQITQGNSIFYKILFLSCDLKSIEKIYLIENSIIFFSSNVTFTLDKFDNHSPTFPDQVKSISYKLSDVLKFIKLLPISYPPHRVEDDKNILIQLIHRNRQKLEVIKKKRKELDLEIDEHYRKISVILQQNEISCNRSVQLKKEEVLLAEKIRKLKRDMLKDAKHLFPIKRVCISQGLSRTNFPVHTINGFALTPSTSPGLLITESTETIKDEKIDNFIENKFNSLFIFSFYSNSRSLEQFNDEMVQQNLKINPKNASYSYEFVVKILNILSILFNVPLRFSCNSTAYISSRLTPIVMENSKNFSLSYQKNNTIADYSYAVYLINMNTLGLRGYFQMRTESHLSTLENIIDLINSYLTKVIIDR